MTDDAPVTAAGAGHVYHYKHGWIPLDHEAAKEGHHPVAIGSEEERKATRTFKPNTTVKTRDGREGRVNGVSTSRDHGLMIGVTHKDGSYSSHHPADLTKTGYEAPLHEDPALKSRTLPSGLKVTNTAHTHTINIRDGGKLVNAIRKPGTPKELQDAKDLIDMYSQPDWREKHQEQFGPFSSEAVTAAGTWEERAHPRGEHGKFRKLDEIMGDLTKETGGYGGSGKVGQARQAIRDGKRAQARTILSDIAEGHNDPKVKALASEAVDRLKPVKVGKGREAYNSDVPSKPDILHDVTHPDHGHIGTIRKATRSHPEMDGRIRVGSTHTTRYRANPEGAPGTTRSGTAGTVREFRTRAEAEHHLAEQADAKAIANAGAAGEADNQPQTPATPAGKARAMVDEAHQAASGLKGRRKMTAGPGYNPTEHARQRLDEARKALDSGDHQTAATKMAHAANVFDTSGDRETAQRLRESRSQLKGAPQGEPDAVEITEQAQGAGGRVRADQLKPGQRILHPKSGLPVTVSSVRTTGNAPATRNTAVSYRDDKGGNYFFDSKPDATHRLAPVGMEPDAVEIPDTPAHREPSPREITGLRDNIRSTLDNAPKTKPGEVLPGSWASTPGSPHQVLHSDHGPNIVHANLTRASRERGNRPNELHDTANHLERMAAKTGVDERTAERLRQHATEARSLAGPTPAPASEPNAVEIPESLPEGHVPVSDLLPDDGSKPYGTPGSRWRAPLPGPIKHVDGRTGRVTGAPNPMPGGGHSVPVTWDAVPGEPDAVEIPDRTMGGGPGVPAWDRLAPSEIQAGDTIGHPNTGRPIQITSATHGPVGVNVGYDDGGVERHVLLPHHKPVARVLPQASTEPDPHAAADQSIEARRAKTAAIIKEAADKYAATGDAKHLETIDRARAAEQAGYQRDVQAYVPEGADVPPARGVGPMERNAEADIAKAESTGHVGNADPAALAKRRSDGELQKMARDMPNTTEGRVAQAELDRRRASGPFGDTRERMRSGADALRQSGATERAAGLEPLGKPQDWSANPGDYEPHPNPSARIQPGHFVAHNRSGKIYKVDGVRRMPDGTNQYDTSNERGLPNVFTGKEITRMQPKQVDTAQRGSVKNKPVGAIVHVRQPGGTQRLGTVVGVDGQHRHVEINPVSPGAPKQKIRIHASQLQEVDKAPAAPATASPSGRSAKMQRAFQAASEGDHAWLASHGFDAQPGDKIHVSDSHPWIGTERNGNTIGHAVNGNGQGKPHTPLPTGVESRLVHEPRTGATAMPEGSAPNGGVSGTQSSNPAARAMTERILANRAAQGEPPEVTSARDTITRYDAARNMGRTPSQAEHNAYQQAVRTVSEHERGTGAVSSRPADAPAAADRPTSLLRGTRVRFTDEQGNTREGTVRSDWTAGSIGINQIRIRDDEGYDHRPSIETIQPVDTTSAAGNLDKYGAPADKTMQQLTNEKLSLPANHREIADGLKAQYMPTGPNHDRGISDDLRRYYLLNNQGGRDEEAAHWLRSAEEQASRKGGGTPATITNRPDRPVDVRAAVQAKDTPTLRLMANDGNLREQERQAAQTELDRRGVSTGVTTTTNTGTYEQIPATPDQVQWRHGTSEEEYAGHPSGKTLHIYDANINGNDVTVDEPHVGDGWRYSIGTADGRYLTGDDHLAGNLIGRGMYKSPQEAQQAALDRLRKEQGAQGKA